LSILWGLFDVYNISRVDFRWLVAVKLIIIVTFIFYVVLRYYIHKKYFVA
jgi:hypothetical protein